MPGSSVAEQVTVNHLVVGSTPTRAAILTQRLTLVGFFISKDDCDVAVTLLNPPTVEKNRQLLRCFRPWALAI